MRTKSSTSYFLFTPQQISRKNSFKKPECTPDRNVRIR